MSVSLDKHLKIKFKSFCKANILILVPVQNTPMYEILGVKKQQCDNGVQKYVEN